MTTITPSARPNIAPSEERVKELRKRASNYGSLPESTVNAILDDYSALKAEVKRLNTWHSTLSEAWKARAEKAEAELAKQAPLIQAVMRAWIAADHPVANSVMRTLVFANAIHEDDILRAALALREEKK